MIGPGKYDSMCAKVREDLNAEGVILIVYGGVCGDGFEAQLPSDIAKNIPSVLRQVADQIEASSSPKLN